MAKKKLKGPEDVAIAKKKLPLAAGPLGVLRKPAVDQGKSGVNLFERLWNRKKFDIVGKKVKGEQKSLGKSRSDAVDRVSALRWP